MSDVRDRLDLVGGLADPLGLPDAADVRRGGDRRRRRARGLAAAVVLAVTAAIAVPAVDGMSDRQSAPPAEQDQQDGDGQAVPRNSGLDGWELARHIAVADEGVALAAGGSLWVVDRHNGEVDPATGRPLGVLHRIDPRSGRTTATVPGAVGGWPASYGGAIWLVSLPAQRLIRVDLDTLAMTMIRTSDADDPDLRGLAVAGGAIWVGNAAEGTLARVDPQTSRVTVTVDLASASDAAADPSQPVVWRGHLWTLLVDSDEIVEVDPRSGDVLARHPNPARVLGEGLAVVGDRLAVTSAGTMTVLESTPSGRLRAGEVITPPVPVFDDVAGLVEAYGRVWQLGWEGGELLELDPDSREVLGRVDVPTIGPRVEVTPTLVAAFGSIWVRVYNRVYEYRPTDG